MKNERDFDAIQDLIKDERLAEARSRIRALRTAHLTPRERVRLVYLARQVYLPELGIKLLYRRVHAEGGHRASATEEERAEYGMALAELGTVEEAIPLLSKVDLRRFPYAFRALTLARFRRWEWKETLPVIETFLAAPGLPVKERLWARARLAMALLHGEGNFARAQQVAERLLEDATRLRFPMIVGETLLSLVQIMHLRKDSTLGLRFLGRLETHCAKSDPDSLLAILARAWRPILRFDAGLMKRAGMLSELKAVRRRLESLGFWESARSFAYYEAVLSRDSKKMLALYFGSPYPGLRRKLLEAFQLSEKDLPGHHDRLVARGDRKGGFAIDLLTGLSNVKGVSLAPGSAPLRCLRAFAHDQYRPPKIAELHERIYSGEYFNPRTSPIRTRQLILRTRRWAKDNGLPLEIRVSRGVYRLHSRCRLVLRLPLPAAKRPDEPAESGALLGQVARARKEFANAEFSSLAVAGAFAISSRSAARLCAEAVQHGYFERFGQGKNTRYQIREEAFPSLGPPGGSPRRSP